MRERIARALFDRNDGNTSEAKWDDIPDIIKDEWLADADAVLSAMEEPVPEMKDAGGKFQCSLTMAGEDGYAALDDFDRQLLQREAEGCWSAMIRAAKGEREESE